MISAALNNNMLEKNGSTYISNNRAVPRHATSVRGKESSGKEVGISGSGGNFRMRFSSILRAPAIKRPRTRLSGNLRFSFVLYFPEVHSTGSCSNKHSRL